jgi:hypothetical protein
MRTQITLFPVTSYSPDPRFPVIAISQGFVLGYHRQLFKTLLRFAEQFESSGAKALLMSKTIFLADHSGTRMTFVQSKDDPERLVLMTAKEIRETVFAHRHINALLRDVLRQMHEEDFVMLSFHKEMH